LPAAIPFPPKPVRDRIVKEMQNSENEKEVLLGKIEDLSRKNRRLILTSTG
jgi:hypothetical protein